MEREPERIANPNTEAGSFRLAFFEDRVHKQWEKLSSDEQTPQGLVVRLRSHLDFFDEESEEIQGEFSKLLNQIEKHESDESTPDKAAQLIREFVKQHYTLEEWEAMLRKADSKAIENDPNMFPLNEFVYVEIDSPEQLSIHLLAYSQNLEEALAKFSEAMSELANLIKNDSKYEAVETIVADSYLIAQNNNFAKFIGFIHRPEKGEGYSEISRADFIKKHAK